MFGGLNINRHLWPYQMNSKSNNVNGKLFAFPTLKKEAGETQPYLNISKEYLIH